MTQIIMLSLNETEFKAFLREALTDILKDRIENNGSPIAEILSIGEAATFLKLKISTLYEKTANKLIPHFKKGNRLYFYRKDLEEWLREGKVKTAKEIQSEAATFTTRKKNWA